MKRRDFLIASSVITCASVTKGNASTLPWSKKFKHAAVVQINLDGILPGQQIFLRTTDGPIVVRYRTAEEIISSRETTISELPDKYARNANLPRNALATDENRTIDKDGKWLVYQPVCTHLGAVTLDSTKPITDDVPHWISCPTHGGRYDSAGRVRAGPPPKNLPIPPASFISQNILEVSSRANRNLEKIIREAHPSTW